MRGKVRCRFDRARSVVGLGVAGWLPEGASACSWDIQPAGVWRRGASCDKGGDLPITDSNRRVASAE